MSAATVAAIAKAAVAVLSNEKTRKALGWVIVAILSPLIVLVVLICAVLSGSSQHNVSAVELCFHGGTISSSATPEYRGYIEDMRGSFAQLDRAIEEINAQCEDGNSLDDTRVKAVFYALYFAAEHPDDSGIRAFTDCFVDYEERTRTVTTTDEEGNEVEVEETYKGHSPDESNAGRGFAQYALGKKYRDGQGVERNIQKAVELFTLAAKQGNSFAAFALGKMYLSDDPALSRNVAAALKWITNAAEHGNQFAQYYLPRGLAATQLCGALWYSGTRHALDAGTESKAAKDYSLPGS